MLAEMSVAELGAWQKFYELEPFGCDQDDLRAGVAASVIANIYRDRKEKPEEFTPAEFIKRRRPEAMPPEPSNGASAQKTPKQLLHILEAMALSRGGADLRKRRPRYE